MHDDSPSRLRRLVAVLATLDADVTLRVTGPGSSRQRPGAPSRGRSRGPMGPAHRRGGRLPPGDTALRGPEAGVGGSARKDDRVSDAAEAGPGAGAEKFRRRREAKRLRRQLRTAAREGRLGDAIGRPPLVRVELDEDETAATVYVDPAGADCRLQDGEAVVRTGRYRVPVAVPFVPTAAERIGGGGGLAVFRLYDRRGSDTHTVPSGAAD